MLNLKHTAITLLLATFIVVSCKVQNKSKATTAPTPAQSAEPATGGTVDLHNSENALDWNGTYNGMVPCADCEGIQTSVTLAKDGSFTRTTTYVGKEEKGTTETGTFEWTDDGSSVTLSQNGEKVQAYKVGENTLFHLDQEGNPIKGDLADNYKLHKIDTDTSLEGKKWVLTKIMGKEVPVKNEAQQAFILFDHTTTSVNGNNGCNVFTGGYTLKGGGQIQINGIAASLRACADMEVSDAFNQVLNTMDNYTVSNGVLSLNKAKMAPLATFKLAE